MNTFRTTRRVEFRDTDAAGIAHFSSFFNFMEQVEHELLRHLGTSVVVEDEAGIISWPRVSASCEFQGAVRFEDVLDVDLRIERVGTKSVTYVFRFFIQGKQVATGRMVSVCCRIAAPAPPQSIPIPEPLARQLRTYVQDAREVEE